MDRRSAPRRWLQIACAVLVCAWLGAVKASDLNPAAINIKLPDQIKWTGNPQVSEQAILYGDPSKPGLYIVLTKWHRASHEPSALSSQRQVYHGAVRNLVGGNGDQV